MGDAADILKACVRVECGRGNLDLHYRAAGRGAPLFLLHPSPLSSAFMVPLMRRLAARATVIAPDTPGFGDSDDIAGGVRDLGPYVAAMIALRRALGLASVAVYGSATGAQIAIEWAKADAQGVAGVVLDNAATFTAAEREGIMDGYFPDLTPVADGAHLARAWQAAHDAALFFPWQRPGAENRVADRLPAAEAIAMTAMGYLAAGRGYERVYRAAFGNERAQRIQPIRVPVAIMRWQGSILKRWTDRLDDFAWGDNVVMARCGPTLAERWSCLERQLPAVLPRARTTAAELNASNGALRYADSEMGQLRYRPPSPRLPLPAGAQIDGRIVLAGLGASSASLGDSETDAWIFELPGHGGSAAPEGLDVATCERAMAQAIDVAGPGRFSIAGVGAASERLAQRLAARNDRLSAVRASALGYRGALPDLAAETSGAHLWRAWHWLRRQFLDRDAPAPEPARLTRMLVDLIAAQRAYRALQPLLEPPPQPSGAAARSRTTRRASR